MAKKKKSNKWLYYVIGAFIVLIIFVVIGRSAGWIGKPKQTEVEVAMAKKVTIVEKVSASGQVQPVLEVKLSPEVSGELIELNVEEGDPVEKDFVLAKIRPDNFIAAVEQSRASLNTQRANLASSRASLSRSKATFTRAEQDYNRQKKLKDENVISEADWQLAVQNYEVAKNDLVSAEESVEAAKFIVKNNEAQLSQAQENLRRATVKSPMTGTVSKLNVEQGETVLGTQQFQGTEMMRIADLNQMEVRVNVNENDIIRVALGDTVLIDVDSYSHLEKEFKGIVTLIANTANDKASADAVTEFEVKIKILNSSYKDLIKEGNKYPFRPGMTASVEIITERKNNILSVPLSSVTTRKPGDDKKFGRGGDDEEEKPKQASNAPKAEEEVKEVVFVNEEGVAKMREVKTGISDYENIEILEGIKEGEEIVSGPFLVVSKRLSDGDAVTSKKEKGKEDDKKEEETDDE
ncbi:efflux RND transporter periplasmic adaptor subunit [Fulvivirga lutimaris]|uniref:efflux RND transporter periplasmic adaptor subunit n=1 Tax=Fulvivirga lutimaris TaxID=1819566 RepID=UPI0012BC26A5|nr:efflux RND transporter periplasmic adaptor subunit [Fulvivirga lutimaris]MTI39511.1 efflux RND transporter periplasmic adaptor subunit [Fulvivirga lutimaris]